MEQKDCPCRKKQCARHGDCDACRAYHAASKRQRPVACERKGLRARLHPGSPDARA